MAKKHLRDIPRGSMAARSAKAKRHVPRSTDEDRTKWVTKVHHEESRGIGDSVVPQFKPIRGTQGPVGMFDRINPTYAMLGAAAGTAVILAVIQTRASTPVPRIA